MEFPYALYRGDPYWVPPLRIAVKELLDRDKHPFYANANAEFFLAMRDGRIVGRVAAIVDRNHNRFHGENAGFFGFFEAVNDDAVAGALLSQARQWVLGRGAQFLRGPMNPSTNYECGMLIEGFESSPMIMMSYNPPYYPGLMERVGLRKAKDLFAYLLDTSSGPGERAKALARRSLRVHGVTVRRICRDSFEADLRSVWSVYNSAWERNWGFVPMEWEEFSHMASEMKPLLVPDLVLLAEVAGRVVGFALALPDINEVLRRLRGRLLPLGIFKILYYKSRIRQARILAFGVLKEYQTKALAASLWVELVRRAFEGGYNRCELSWELEDNMLVNRSVKTLGAVQYKTYRIYQISCT